ncbi:sugar ABC transporter permease [Leifsonia sp. Root4]|uniref:carbohydrate ABC transporter permease n=1 Tax=Leifsonia sp. Root4 TaxID=1736525 RepID=UPI0009EC827E|nr:sugar ABC transporter permease [Leifsonia sp. Root4]
MSAPALVTASRRQWSGAGRWWTPYVFIAPFVVLFAVFLVGPILIAIVNSLFSEQSSGLGFGGSEVLFVGLDNFARALADSDFVTSFGRVVLFGVVQVPIMLAISVVLALLFDSGLVAGSRFFQLTVFLPYAVPGVIAALLWGFLYQPSVSPIIQGLASIGIDVNLLAPGTVLWSIANVATWSTVGINMIILFSALQALPRELYEAAKLDGAGQIRIALGIKLPMIAPALLLTTVSSIIGTLQLFNEPQVLKSITANISSDYTPNMAIYAASTLGKDSHLSSAMAILLGLATLIISLIVLKATNRSSQKKATDG